MKNITVLLTKNARILRTLLVAALQNRWRESLFGVGWVLFNPLTSLMIHWFIFKHFMGRNDPLYFTYVCVGLLPWYMLKTSLDVGVSTLSYKIQVMKNFAFNPLLYNMVWVIEYYIHYITLMLILIMVGYSTGWYDLSWHGFLYSLPAQFAWLLASFALVHLFSLGNVFFRDVKYIVDFSMRLLFLLTPILYRLETVPQLHFVSHWNPFYYLLRPFHLAFHLVEGHYGYALAQAYLVATLIVVFCLIIHDRLAKRIYLYAD